MKAIYNKEKMFKPIPCYYCGEVAVYIYYDIDKEPTDIIAVHNRKRGNCLKKEIEELTPQIIVGGIDFANDNPTKDMTIMKEASNEKTDSKKE